MTSIFKFGFLLSGTRRTFEAPSLEYFYNTVDSIFNDMNKLFSTTNTAVVYNKIESCLKGTACS